MISNSLWISAFDSEERNGGGWASRRILSEHNKELVIINRPNSFIVKLLYIVTGILLLPFIHTAFTRFIPLSLIFQTNGKTNLFFNFSQTFGASLFFKGHAHLICHDLQYHRRFFFKRWVLWSEGFLLRRASTVITMSNRDAEIVHEYYKLPKSKIKSLQNTFLRDIKPFTKEIFPKGELKLVFIGGLERKENLEAIQWFDKFVAPYVDGYELSIVGNSPDSLKVNRSNFKYLGFIQDLHSFLKKADIVIAPMQSDAGIKIKVIEALELGVPVLGTTQAYSGIYPPSFGYCSNEPDVWIATLKSPKTFSYTK